MVSRLLGRSLVLASPFVLAVAAALGVYLRVDPGIALVLALVLGAAAVSLAGLWVPVIGHLGHLREAITTASIIIALAAASVFLGSLSSHAADRALLLPPCFQQLDGSGPVTVAGAALGDAAEGGDVYRVPVRLTRLHYDGAEQSWNSRAVLLFRRSDGSGVTETPVLWGKHFVASVTPWCPDDGHGCLLVAESVTPVPRDGFWARAASVRGRLRGTLGRGLRLLPASTRAVTGALTLGDRSYLSGELLSAFRHAGLSHVLALSGMHLGILAGGVSLLVGRIFRKSVGVAVGIALAWIYLIVVGPGPSLLRAALMFTIWGAIRLARQRTEPVNVLGIAFLVMIAVWPTKTREVGFALSFVALTGLLVVGVPIGRRLEAWLPPAVAVPLGASVGAFAATAPLAWGLFGFVAPAGILASVVVAPLAVLVLWSGALLLGSAAFGYLSLPLFWLSRHLQSLMLQIVKLVAAAPRLTAYPEASRQAGRLFASSWGGILVWVPLGLCAAVAGYRLLVMGRRCRRLAGARLLV